MEVYIMDQIEYREMKESGGLVDDAGLQEQEEGVTEENEDVEDTSADEQEEGVETSEESEDGDLPELSEKEKTAFEKRRERDERKMREKIEAELKDQYEKQYGRHKQVIDLLGGDPDAIEKRIRENQVMAEANRLAEQNGWDDEQTRWYVE